MKIRSVAYLAENMLSTAKRFPLVLLSAILLAIGCIYNLEIKASLDDAKYLFSLALGVSFFFSIDLLLESRGLCSIKQRTVAYALGLGLLSWYYKASLSNDTKSFYYIFLQLFLAIHLLVSFIVSLKLKGENLFWQLNKTFFIRFFFSFINASVFFIGLSIALLTSNALFSLDIKSEVFTYLWFISVFILQTWHFLAGIPRNFSGLEKITGSPKELRLCVQYLLIPLVTLYMLILYIYMAKIIITGSWPSGYVGWLVSIMSVLGVFNLLLIAPEKNKTENKWISTYTKNFYILILPLLAMLFVAIWKRTSEYGITENRYFLIVLGSLLFALSMYFIFSRKKRIRIVPISLFVVTIASIWGPFSAYNVSFKSQYHRARSFLHKNGLLVGERTRKTQSSVSINDQRELSSVFDYLIRNHGSDSISHWFPNETIKALSVSDYSKVSLKSYRQTSSSLMKHLGLKYVSKHNRNLATYFSYTSALGEESLDISKFSYVNSFNSYNPTTFNYEGKELSFKMNKDESAIEGFQSGKLHITFPLSSLLDSLRGGGYEDKSVENKDMLVKGISDKMKATLFIQRISGRFSKENLKNINSISALIFLE